MKRSNRNVPAPFVSHALTPSAGNRRSHKYWSNITVNIDSAAHVRGDVAVILQLLPSSVTIKHELGYAVNAIQDGCCKSG